VPKETCKRRTGRKSLGDTFFQTHDDARDQLFFTFPSGIFKKMLCLFW